MKGRATGRIQTRTLLIFSDGKNIVSSKGKEHITPQDQL
jgi:hypothetical protein